jgi:hypothetical protein
VTDEPPFTVEEHPTVILRVATFHEVWCPHCGSIALVRTDSHSLYHHLRARAADAEAVKASHLAYHKQLHRDMTDPEEEL